VLFAAAGDALGWNGIALLAAVLIATCLWLLHRQLLSEGIGLLPATALTLVAAMAGTVHWLARPHLFTLLLTVISPAICGVLTGDNWERARCFGGSCR